MYYKIITTLLFILLLGAGNGFSQQVNISIPDTSVDAGSEIEVPVLVDEFAEEDGAVSGEWEFITSSGMISIIDADASGYLLDGTNLMFNSTTGRLAFAGADTITGTGTLFTLTVQVNANASKFDEATIGFRNAILNEGNPSLVTESGTIKIRGISIDPQSPSNPVIEGNTFQFNLEGDVEPPVTWSTSDNSIASIDSNGLLSGITPGTIQVYAEDSNGLTDETSLFRIEPQTLLDLTLSVEDATITQTLEDTVAVMISDISGLDIVSGQFELHYPANKIEILSVITEGTILEGTDLITDFDGNTMSAAFADADPYQGEGALVNLHVQVPRNASGSATITPQNILFNESIEAQAESGTITIEQAPTPEIDPLQAELTVGDTEQFTVISGGMAPYTWSSSDPDIATIDPVTGQLDAISRGTVQITATDADNFSSEESEVVVNDITLSISDHTMGDGNVPLEVMDVTSLGIYSYEIEVEYDPEVVGFDQLETSGTLSDGMSTSASAEEGVVTIAAASASPMSGEGSLIDIVFKRSENPGSSQESDLRLKRVQFNEPGSDAPTATRIHGSISVEGVSWTGGGDGSSWDDPANWSSSAVPDDESDILIGLNPGSSYSITIPDSATVNSLLISSENADLELQDDLVILTSYIQSAGTISGSGDLSVNGTLTWEAGTMSGSGSVFPNDDMIISETDSKVLSERSIMLQGDKNLTITGRNLDGRDGALIEIGNEALIDITTDNSGGILTAGADGAILRNYGNIQKTEGSTSILTIEWTLENSGNITLNQENAALRFTGPIADNNGSYHAASGSLEFSTDGTYAFADGSSITSAPAGTIRFGAISGDSEVTVNGSYEVNGTTRIQSNSDGVATLILPEQTDLIELGGEAVIVGGSQGELLLQDDAPLTIGSLILNEGSYMSLNSALTVTESYQQTHQTATIESDDDITVEGDFTWSGGTMAGNGTTLANNGISISGSSESNTKNLDERDLNVVNGEVDYRGDLLFGGNGSSFIVGENAVMNLRPTNETTELGILDESSSSPVLLNQGTLQSSNNNNVFTVNWDFENEGLINLGNNNLVIEIPGVLQNSGTLSGSGNFTGDVDNVNGGLIFPGTDSEIGQLQIGGTVTQDSQSTVKFKLAGTSAGSTYDQLRADNLILDGTLSVELINDFSPEEGDVFQTIIWPGGSLTGNFATLEGMEGDGLTLAIRYLDEQLEIYDGSFGSSPGSAGVSISVDTPPFQRIGRSVPIDVTVSNVGEASMQRIRVENFSYNPPPSTAPDCPTNDAYENLKCRMEKFGVTPPPPEDGMEEEYPFLLQERFPEAIGGSDNGGNGGGESSEFTSVTNSGGSFGISGTEECTTNEAINPSVKAGPPVTDDDLSECAYELAKLALEVVPGADCFKLGAGIVTSIGEGIHGGQFDLLGYMSANMVGAINCAGDAVPATKAIKIMKTLNDVASGAGGIKSAAEACGRSAGGGGTVSASGSSQTTCIGSYDPNDKVGPTGVLDERYIASGDSLPYVVFFENLDEATAAAQKVIISDTLDTDVIDFDTFSFGMIAWSDTSVSMESDVHSTSKDVDLRPEMDLILRIEADLNTSTGLIKWVFTSLDPETMEPTLDPLAGFLPPNEESPEGEGLVSYYVSMKEDIPSNTEFGRSARIIFDENDPIDTPLWSNTLDTEPPVSSVEPLDTLQTELEFTVNWDGEDDASGIEHYTIYVSENGEDFTIWQEETTERSAVFTANDETEYEFISKAADWTGNVEELRDEADTKTLVSLSTSTEEDPEIPDQYALDQNYPNPFNPTTTIQYGLPNSGDVLLQVYDMMGRRVATLVNEHQNAGWHDVTFDASNLASGMYIYRIQSGEYVNNRKLILIK